MGTSGRSGRQRLTQPATDSATPPLTAKPRPSALAAVVSGNASSAAKSTSFASNIPMTSSKVSTKSTSERIVRRLASSFFAAQGPINATLQPGCSFFTSRPLSTIGVSAIEMHSAYCGNSRFAITDHEGQQLVPIHGSFSGTFLTKSSASSKMHRSAPTATSTTSWKPSALKAARSFPMVRLGPNWPTTAGARAA